MAIGCHLPEREFLGSSYKPKSKIKENNLEQIMAEEAKLLLYSGCTPEEINKCYSGFSIDDLVQMQAPIKKRIGSKEEAYLAIAELRKKDGRVAVGLIREAYDVEESISDGSLKAYIAHDTMKNTDEKSAENRFGTFHQKNRPGIPKQKNTGQLVIDDLAILPEGKVMEKHGLSKGQLNAFKAHQDDEALSGAIARDSIYESYSRMARRCLGNFAKIRIEV